MHNSIRHKCWIRQRICCIEKTYLFDKDNFTDASYESLKRLEMYHYSRAVEYHRHYMLFDLLPKSNIAVIVD